MTDLLELAARCEAAEGADRQLDADIADPLPVCRNLNPRDTRGNVLDHVPAYTASIDAAMTLVPEGWSHGYSWNATHKNAQAHCEFIPKAPFAFSKLLMANSSKCATPALALCAAALRARAS